ARLTGGALRGAGAGGRLHGDGLLARGGRGARGTGAAGAQDRDAGGGAMAGESRAARAALATGAGLRAGAAQQTNRAALSPDSECAWLTPALAALGCSLVCDDCDTRLRLPIPTGTGRHTSGPARFFPALPTPDSRSDAGAWRPAGGAGGAVGLERG